MSRDVTLVELLDRLLGKGVVVWGDLTLAVADIDLVQLELRTLLASSDSARRLGSRRAASSGRPMQLTATEAPKAMLASPPSSSSSVPGLKRSERAPTGGRIDADPENVERGLAQLVLTVVELLRQLMERQAIRRVEGGTLDEEQVERLGTAFMKLEERMQELKDEFGLTSDDLNLNLGPLGDLM